MPEAHGSSLQRDDDRFDVMGIPLHDLHRDTIADRVFVAASAKRKMLVVNANANLVVLSQKQTWLRSMFKHADIAFCDGAGVQLAALILSGRRLNRTTPPEWIGSVLDRLGPDASIFWLGGTEAAVTAAAETFSTRYGVATAGTQHGYFDVSPGSPETKAVVEHINAARPSILLVNMGMPQQERWLWDNWDQLQPGVAITAGALVDHAAGSVRRPPRWVASMGIEWLVRLIREPRRLWRRYLLGLPVFGIYLLRYRLTPTKRSS
ncbi:WecB/TagA/CpsF family glycosyltransferase [Lichenicola cladoniae]|uniref:WecB/TagA/CpsF family glycosyltransferase n=1 Tax=Lichenicola cladoniae TaxID=1484109 RepID=A0A6M8HR54_9PROT|nr:WecB/TagA/CpsF family glycosyltransferase [Lichenicola cladoniae]NPD69112.1 WecB/TagA/CpsF family glycosyltransferase [Acetobacteraceae bacterium]QKE90934.1 WecB/TagA/CpsF family glycosyltransferase [Lichenicola cladoniae]